MPAPVTADSHLYQIGNRPFPYNNSLKRVWTWGQCRSSVYSEGILTDVPFAAEFWNFPVYHHYEYIPGFNSIVAVESKNRLFRGTGWSYRGWSAKPDTDQYFGIDGARDVNDQATILTWSEWIGSQTVTADSASAAGGSQLIAASPILYGTVTTINLAI